LVEIQNREYDIVSLLTPQTPVLRIDRTPFHMTQELFLCVVSDVLTSDSGLEEKGASSGGGGRGEGFWD